MAASGSSRPMDVRLTPNDGSATKPLVVHISDASLKALTGKGSSLAKDTDKDKDGSRETNNNLKSMVKQLAGLGAITMLLNKMVANSQVLNAYQSAMGKVFGGIMDMLMLPLTPILNLMLVFLGKLMIWLVNSGVLNKIQKVMEQVAKDIEAIGKFFMNLFRAIFKGDLGEIAKVIVTGFKDAIKSIFSSKVGMLAAALVPSMTLAAGGFAIGGPAMAARGFMLPLLLGAKVLGGPAGAAKDFAWSKTGGALMSKFGWGGGGGVGTPPIVPPGGAGGAGAGGVGGLGMAGGLMKFAGAAGAGLTVGIIGTSVSSSLLGKMGVEGKANSTMSNALGWGMGGATAGAMIGGPVGAAIGGLVGLAAGGLYGYFKGGKKKSAEEQAGETAAANGGDITNSYNKNSNNTINVTISTITTNSDQAVNEIVKAMESKLGYQAKSSTGTFSGFGLPSKNTLTWKQAAVMSLVPAAPIASKILGS